MTRLFAIDPGNEESGWCDIDVGTRRPMSFGTWPNADLLDKCYAWPNTAPAAIEMIESYGMPVGREVFDTVWWIGRFYEAMSHYVRPSPVDLVFRRVVRIHHCQSTKAGDTNVRQALVDRFAPGQRNHGKGTTTDPGWFHGFSGDVWAAYALAVHAADVLEGHQP